MVYMLKLFANNPELAIFLTLAVGFVIGRIRVGSFKLGNVVGTLIAGVLIGQLDITVDPTVKSVFFALFLFATGYKVGPQFFRGLRKNALPQVALTVVLCVTSLLTTVVAARLGYDSGTAAGLMAGAFTESTVIGTASDTIDRLDLPEAEKTRLKNNIPVAYAVSYLVGTGFIVWFLSVLAPRLLRVDLKAESRKLATQVSSEDRTAEKCAPGVQGVERSCLSPRRCRGGSNRRRFRDALRAGSGSSWSAFDAGRAPRCQSRKQFSSRGDVVAIAARRRVLLERTSAPPERSRGPCAPRLSDGNARRGCDEARRRGAIARRAGGTTRARRRPR